MRNVPNLCAERQRVAGPPRSNCGSFIVGVGDVTLGVIISDSLGWDHVSVSTANRCPTWDETCFVKDMFFRDDEVAMQLHPARAKHINNHPFCLHLWRPQTAEECERVRREWSAAGEFAAPVPSPGMIPLPPLEMV